MLIPPPLPPRKHQQQHQEQFCQTFPRRRKNLFHHLGVGVEPALSSNNQEIFVIQKKTLVNNNTQVFKKDLEKFLGVPVTKHCKNKKKDLSSFLGVHRAELERVVRRHSYKTRDNIHDSEYEGSMSTSTSTDSSSLWSSF